MFTVNFSPFSSYFLEMCLGRLEMLSFFSIAEEDHLTEFSKKNSKFILLVKISLEGFSYNLQQAKLKSAH